MLNMYLHFNIADIDSKKKRLKITAVPFLNDENTEKSQSRLERRINRNIRIGVALPSSTTTSNSIVQKEVISEISSEEINNQVQVDNETALDNEDSENNLNNSVNESNEWDRPMKMERFIEPSTLAPSFQDFGVQVNSTEITRPTFCDNLTTDSELSTATGIESFKVLDTILNIVVYVKDESERHVKMSLKERVIMTFVKLKQNLSYSFLALIFKCYSAKHCQRIFSDTVKMLSLCLKPAIPWPSREEIRRNMPECFESFEDVRVVLDCTEIFIQRPAELCCQILTYSHYKSGQTCKIMTGVSPAGNITFISKCYGGRATDAAIFKESELIRLLEPGDAVMVDRGFLIDEVCEVNRWKCIRPPFLKDKKQFSKEESILTARIAKARVHIERSNQRIKTFKILGSVMPVALVPLIEDICTVVCAVINMSSPILSDSKFMELE